MPGPIQKAQILLSLCLTVYFSLTVSSFGQRLVTDSLPPDSLLFREATPLDTHYFKLLYRNLEEVQRDTHIAKSRFQFNPAESGVFNEHLHLGNIGSPAQKLWFEADEELGFHSGLDQFDLYLFDSDLLPFYRTTNTVALLKYTQGSDQEQSNTYVEFGREFNGPSGLSLRYRRINDIGIYAHQKNRHTAFEIGAYLLPEEKAFKSFISLQTFTFNSEDNGGIASDTFFSDPVFDDRQAVPVRSETAQTQYKGWEFRMTNYLDLKKKGTTDFLVKQDFFYRLDQYKFFDQAPDSAYYGIFSPGDPGWRQFVKRKVFNHYLGLNYDSEKGRFPASIDLGLRYERNWVEHEPFEYRFNHLFAEGRYRQQLAGIGKLDANAAFGLLDHAGTFEIGGALKARIKKVASLSLHAIIGNYEPSLLSEQLPRFDDFFWKNDFNRYQRTTIGGDLVLLKFPLRIRINSHLLQNYIYYDSDRLPQQSEETINVFQFGVFLSEEFGHFLTEHEVYIQNSTAEAIRLPVYFGRHFAGFEFFLYQKNLQLNTGAELRYMEDYNGYGYFPLIGQFHHSDTPVNHGYRLDGLVGFDVKSFRVFVRFQNINYLWDEKIRYSVSNYPLFDYRFRMGLSWRISD